MRNFKALKIFGVLPGDKISLLKKNYDTKTPDRVTGIVTEIHPKLRWVRIFYPKYGFSECFNRIDAAEAQFEVIE